MRRALLIAAAVSAAAPLAAAAGEAARHRIAVLDVRAVQGVAPGTATILTNIVHLEEVAAAVPPVQRSVIVLDAAADHLAAVRTGAGFVLYVADGATGRVTRVPLAGPAQQLAGPAATTPGHMALAADAAGAVWTDAGARTVTEYRASDGAVFRLAGPATAAQPWGVCLGPWSGYASWSDAGDHVVRGEYR